MAHKKHEVGSINIRANEKRFKIYDHTMVDLAEVAAISQKGCFISGHMSYDTCLHLKGGATISLNGPSKSYIEDWKTYAT